MAKKRETNVYIFFKTIFFRFKKCYNIKSKVDLGGNMLKLKEVEQCLYPTTIEEAAKLLKESGENTRIVGGGLHLTAFPNPQIKTLIFLNNLKLNYLKETDKEISIGATTTISELANATAMSEYLKGNVKKLLQSIASELLRNQITTGGSVAQREPYSDIASLLLVLNARIVLNDGEKESTIPLYDFYKSDFRAILKRSIIKEVLLEKFDSSYKFGMERFTRNATDIPLLNLGILLQVKEGIIKNASVVVGARPGPSEKFVEAEEFLNGKIFSNGLAEKFGEFIEKNVDVAGDIRIGKEYRAHIAGVFAKRILAEFMEE